MPEENTVVITYETLFEILRRERDKDELQKLNATFFSDVLNYINQKKPQDTANPFSTVDSQKSAIQLVNARKLAKDIYDRREKKILEMAVIKSRASNALVNTSALLSHEKALFDELVKMLSVKRDQTLTPLFSNQIQSALVESPNFGYENGLKQPVEAKKEEDTSAAASELSDGFKPQKPLEKPQSASQAIEEPKELKMDDNSNDTTGVNIEFLHPIPKFIGPNLEIYGPYGANDHAILPEKIASVLIKKGRAKII